MYAIKNDNDVVSWLGAFGYEDVESMQAAYGLKVDGFVGPVTMAAMERPRCGVSDQFRAAANCKWRKRALTYYNGRGGFSLFHKEMSLRSSRVRSKEMIDEGFERWAQVLGFKFTRTMSFNPKTCDIWIGGGSGPRFDFDGPGRTLAWAYMPCGRFDYLESRFDNAEQFTDDPSKGDQGMWIYAKSVWLHELGHLLGLDHSKNPNDLMAPYYNPSITDLQPGDIKRIKALYGVA
jgi:hypothetical protein